MGPYLGDYLENSVVSFCWNTSNKSGASVSRATNGSICVYKDNNVLEETVGITDVENFDGVVGVHNCSIDLSSSSFYAGGHDYSVVLFGAQVDGEWVNAVLAEFSIENRAGGQELFKKAAKVMVNKAVQDKATGDITYYDDDGETEILTHTIDDEELTTTRDQN